MADTRKTWPELDVLFGDNTAGAISPQDLRDGFTSLEPHVAAAAPTASDDGTQGFDKGHAWINTSTTPHSLYKCLDGSTAAAVWVKVYPVTGSAAWGGITGTLADQTDLQAALDLKANTAVTINAQTGTAYTLALTDAGKLATLTNAAAIALTIPTNAAVAFPVGTVIALAQLGAGVVTVAGDTGVNVNSLDSALSLAGQYATASLTKTATDTWLLSGGLA